MNDYQAFISLLDKEDKDNALLFILKLLEVGENLVTIYESYLIPALRDYQCKVENKELCIWKEHTRTSIIRTILEASYQYVIKKKKPSNHKKVLVVCPKEEYHEIGAIIANHYFSLAGFDSKYIGANTPSEDIISAVSVLKPDYLALSVTNYYNLVVTKKLTEALKKQFPEVRIVLGGQAFLEETVLEQMTFDHYLKNLSDITDLGKEVLS